MGTWARYRPLEPIDLPAVGPDSPHAAKLGLITGRGWIRFAQVPSLDALEANHPLVLDPDGALGVLERPAVDARLAQELMDAYLLGDARMSHLAAEALGKRLHDL